MNTSLSLKQKIRLIVANLSLRERFGFIISLTILTIGIFGGLVALSNKFTTIVPVYGGTYREGIIGSPRFINPVLANSDADRDLTSLIYSGVLRIDEKGIAIPDLAQSWTISEDGKTYTVTLKDKLTFHDRKPLTSSDIVFTVNQIQNPALKSPLRVAWEGVTASAPDEKTVVFTLQKPYAGFLNQLTLGILPEHIWKNVETANWQTSVYNTEPIGSGPYKLKDVSRSRIGVPEQYELEAFKKFTLGKPYIANVVIATFANKSDAYDAFDAKNINGLAMVNPTDVDQVTRSNTTTVTAPLPRVFGMFLNPIKNKLFSDAAVTQALNLGIDKQALIDSIFKGYASPLSGPLPQSKDMAVTDFAEKQKLAAKILDAAGWKMNTTTGIREKTFASGKGTITQPLTFSLSTANTPELENSAHIIADQLEKIGINVDVKIFEIGTLNEHVIRGRDFESLLFGQVIKHDTDLYAFWHSSQKTDPGLNITGYTNKTTDTLLESALKESDQVKREAIYQKVAQQLAKDAPVVFLYTPDFIAVFSKDVRHVVMPPITGPENRFMLIYRWYQRTDHVWNGFIKNTN
jgi:peptide/nickel transport system substrate-binding protein